MLPVERTQLSREQSECLVGPRAESESLLGRSAKHKNNNSVYCLYKLYTAGAMADMEERESEEIPNREDPSESEGGDEDEEDCEQPSKKKKKVNVPRQWNEVNRWNREDHALQNIKAFIRAELDDLNRSAGILHVPGAHKDHNEYGDFQFRRQWITRDRVQHFLYACPLRQRCIAF